MEPLGGGNLASVSTAVGTADILVVVAAFEPGGTGELIVIGMAPEADGVGFTLIFAAMGIDCDVGRVWSRCINKNLKKLVENCVETLWTDRVIQSSMHP